MKCTCTTCEIRNIFFNTIDEDSLDAYCSARVEKVIPKGKKFIVQGKKIKEFVYMKSGLVKLHMTDENGLDHIISFGMPMDFVNVHNVFSEKRYSFSVTAIEDTVICIFDIKIIENLIRTNGAFAISLIKQISNSSNRIISNSMNIIKKNVYGKLAHILLFFSEKVYFTNEFDLPISRKDMALYTGLSIETIIRAISEFRDDGILKVYGKRIEIIDIEKLKGIYIHS